MNTLKSNKIILTKLSKINTGELVKVLKNMVSYGIGTLFKSLYPFPLRFEQRIYLGMHIACIKSFFFQTSRLEREREHVSKSQHKPPTQNTWMRIPRCPRNFIRFVLKLKTIAWKVTNFLWVSGKFRSTSGNYSHI